MPDDITPAEAPAAEEAQEKPAEQRTYSEAEHNAAVQAAIQARFKNIPSKEELAALKAKAAKADELEAAQMSEVEKAIARAEAAEKRIADAEAAAKAAQLSSVRLQAATARGLDPDVAPYLAGDDEEAIAKAADIISRAKPNTPAVAGSNPPGEAPDPKDSDPFLKGFWGR